MPIPKAVTDFIADTKADQEIDRLSGRRRTLLAKHDSVRGRVAAALHYNRYDEHRQAVQELDAIASEIETVTTTLRAKVDEQNAKAEECRQLLAQHKATAAAQKLASPPKVTARPPASSRQSSVRSK